eukprot:1247015-Amphidinium_carterae.2
MCSLIQRVVSGMVPCKSRFHWTLYETAKKTLKAKDISRPPIETTRNNTSVKIGRWKWGVALVN